jgi:acyl dehydratase
MDADKVRNWKFRAIEHTYTQRDTILFALGLGCGSEASDRDDLKYVYEQHLVALPTMAVVLASPGNWLGSKESTVDYTKVLHGEQYLILHSSLPPAGTVVGTGRIVDLLDKGKDKGAVLYAERTITDKATGALIATVTSAAVLRGDGGFGGKPGPQPQPHKLPASPPATHIDIKTHVNSALIYRLSGDWNPLHADPQVAKAGGFKSPILHGLCTYGVAGRAVVRACCGGDPTRLKSLQVRFSAPVYPGETIRTEMWPETNRVSFRARALERDVVVLNNGFASLA